MWVRPPDLVIEELVEDEGEDEQDGDEGHVVLLIRDASG
jgi:hypothetical protein